MMVQFTAVASQYEGFSPGCIVGCCSVSVYRITLQDFDTILGKVVIFKGEIAIFDNTTFNVALQKMDDLATLSQLKVPMFLTNPEDVKFDPSPEGAVGSSGAVPGNIC